jgi:hypothetical protein
MRAKEFQEKSHEIGGDFESPKDEVRYRERIEQLIYNQDKQLKDNGVPFVERIKIDNPDFEEVEELEKIYTDISDDKIVENTVGLYNLYEKCWNREGIKNLIEKLPNEKLEIYPAKTSNGNLASLEVRGEDLNNLSKEDKSEVIGQLSTLRNLWYCHYGFYDLRLVASYLEYGKAKGMSQFETLSNYIEKVSTEDENTYFLAFGGKKRKEGFLPKKVLGHIGMVHGIELSESTEKEIYEPKKHVLHVDRMHLSQEKLMNGARIVKEVKLPVELKNVKEITRFMKSPFVPPRKQVFVSSLLTSKLFERFVGMQKDQELLIFADLDRNIAGKSVSQMGFPNSNTNEKYTLTKEKQGLLMPRWLKDNTNLVKTGPTLPLFFTGRDLVETKVFNGSEYEPMDYVKKVFDAAKKPSKFQSLRVFHKLIKESLSNQLNFVESKHVILEKNGNGNYSHNEVLHTGQVGGPEGLIRIKNKELAYEIAKKYYGCSPNYLPLPYNLEGFDFSKLDSEVLEQILYPMTEQGFNSAKYTFDKDAQITPLGNVYRVLLKNAELLESQEKEEELKRQETLVKNLLARSKFFPIINSFLEDTKETVNGIKFFERLRSKYFLSSKLSLGEVRKLTSVDSVFNVQSELFSDTLFLCAGLGTGGMQLIQDLRKSIPVADYILIDHGVVDSDNGHQIPSLNELGASKLSVAIDGMMRDVPIAPWGSKENLIGGVVGFAAPYSETLDNGILEKIKASGKENIVLVDEIDVTDGGTILQKIAFHEFAINLAQNLDRPVSVVCGLDLGQSAVWRGNFVYDKNAKPFYGLLNFKEGAEERAGKISPFVLLAPLLIGSKLPAELELLLADMAQDGSLEGVGQTVYSSNQSSTHVGNTAILNAMMQSLDYEASEMRKAVKTTYVENPMQKILSEEAYEKYRNYSGREGALLLPFVLYLSSQIYDTTDWPSSWASLVDPKIAYQLQTLITASEF